MLRIHCGKEGLDRGNSASVQSGICQKSTDPEWFRDSTLEGELVQNPLRGYFSHSKITGVQMVSSVQHHQFPRSIPLMYRDPLHPVIKMCSKVFLQAIRLLVGDTDQGQVEFL